MSLESANYVHQLIATNPTVTDKMKQGDDHLRMIKRALQATFPNIKGPMNNSHDVLNSVPANLAGIIQALIANTTRKGCIVAHDPQIPIPNGWAVCDGSVVPGYGTVPDLRGRFIKGASPTQAAGQTGGNSEVQTSTAAGHTHGGKTGGHSLTIAEMPRHNPKIWYRSGGYQGGTLQFVTNEMTNQGSYQEKNPFNNQPFIEPIGQDQPHDHPMTTDGEHNHQVLVEPPYYTLIWIVKTADYVAP